MGKFPLHGTLPPNAETPQTHDLVLKKFTDNNMSFFSLCFLFPQILSDPSQQNFQILPSRSLSFIYCLPNYVKKGIIIPTGYSYIILLPGFPKNTVKILLLTIFMKPWNHTC